MKAKDVQEVIKDMDPEMDVVIRVFHELSATSESYFDYDLDIYETDDPITKKIVLVFEPNTP
jgi:hypothetical protein